MGLVYLGMQFEALGSKVRRIYTKRCTIPMPDTSITTHSTTTAHHTPVHVGALRAAVPSASLPVLNRARNGIFPAGNFSRPINRH